MNSTSLNETPGQYTEPREPKKPDFAYDFHFFYYKVKFSQRYYRVIKTRFSGDRNI